MTEAVARRKQVALVRLAIESFFYATLGVRGFS